MAPSHEERMKLLKVKREAFKCELETFENLLESHEEGMSATNIRVQLEELELEATAFNKTQTDLDNVDDGHSMRERIGLKTHFNTCKARALDIIQKASVSSRGTTVIDPRNTPYSSTESTETEINLPKINLPIFAGSYEDWPGFADQFRSTVHDNVRIDDCKKLMYLRSCLRHEAAKAIESLGNTAINYSVAWSILEKRYNQPAIIVANHLKALFDMPQIHRPYHQDLQSFLNNIETHYRALQALNQPSTDTLLLYLFTSKIDRETVQKWKEHTQSIDFPQVEELFKFLHNRCKVLEPAGSSYNSAHKQISPQHHHYNRNSQQINPKTPIRQLRSTTQQAFVTQSRIICNFCKGTHFSQNCEKFTSLSIPDRSKLVKERNLCFNCLRRNHSVTECQATTCKHCHKRHHSLLHNEVGNSSQPVQANLTCLSTITMPNVILSTAIINVLDSRGKTHPCRVLLDSCSQAHFLSEKMFNKLGLKSHKVSIPLSGTNQMNSKINRAATTELKSRYSNYSAHLTFLIVKEISQPVPSQTMSITNSQIPSDIKLADPKFNQSSEIDGLIGAQIFWDLIHERKITLADKTTKLRETELGWIVTGEIPSTHKSRHMICNLTIQSVNEDIQKFWSIEECPSTRILSPEEQACEHHYTTHTTRNSIGRYIVALPFKQANPKLGDTYQVALKRFLSLERSLSKNNIQRVQYHEFLREYEKLGHMSKIHDNGTDGCYLPHHPVVKMDSITTKVRVVFDASARSSTGISLNETLMIGPTIQDDLVSIITRFRMHKYVLTADITKMYRQIELKPEDRKYHKILWRENINDPIKVYQLNTVTYGTASAPYLAIKTLHQLAHDEGHNYPIGAQSLLKDFYVDDVLTGKDSIDQAITLRDELIGLTAKGGFELRQWVSNEPKLTESLKNHHNVDLIALDNTDTKKTLGLYWKPTQDTLGYSLKETVTACKITKRTILSRIAQLFDPLGLLGPIIVQAKLIMQDLWKSQIDWDEVVPTDIYTSWMTFQAQLKELHRVNIPRRVTTDNYTKLQLHGFCDASERAYGACIYLRSTDSSQHHTSHLLCSKSRVAPLKTQTLPRLELCAAVLLVKLYQLVTKALNITFEKIIFWSDSTIVLHWINTAPHTLKSFIANRVSSITNSTNPQQWRHVTSEDNAADALSRGINPNDIVYHPTWYHGPRWLSQSEDAWPNYKLRPIEIPEKRKIIVLKTTTSTEFQVLDKFSSFNLLKRVMAYCLRFINNTRHKNKHIGTLTIKELQEATNRIISLVQKNSFAEELHDITKHAIASRKNKLQTLSPFIDANGILRVGGRLAHSELPYKIKHPVILPQSHHVTNLIIRETHITHGHRGVQNTLNAIRQSFWPINGKIAVKSIIRKCLTCHKMEPTIPQYPIGQLPKDRVKFSRPFLVVGVDYCGPFFIKEKKHRNNKKLKTYAAIFVCFSTKAVHVELVSDLTTDAFLAALKRFFARRGKCTDIYSDNATTFTGANRELEKIHTILNTEQTTSIHTYLQNNSIKWHFIPPRAPHFGGLWEAAVKSLKHHLLRIMKNTLFTFEELATCLTEIEAILNSRPLTPLSSDPNDLNPLTPGHFLIGDSLTSTPECDLTVLKAGRLSAWQHIQQLRQHFWNRWYKEYLNHLTIRKKWHQEDTTDVKDGMLVILKEDNTPPLHWPMARIVATHPGEDGIIRVVTVKTVHGQYKRSIKKIAPLPIDYNDNPPNETSNNSLCK